MSKLELKSSISELVGLVNVVKFDIAPVITTKNKYYTTNYVKGKKYSTTLTTTEFLEEMMKDIFTAWYGNAFDKILDYYADIKWVENNKDYYVIRGKIKLKNSRAKPN